MIPESAQNLFDEAQASLSKKLQGYSKSVAETLAMSDLNLQEKALTAGSVHHGYINCLFAEEATLQKMYDAKDKKEAEYVERYGQQGIPRYKTMEEAKETEILQKIEKIIKEQKEVIRYLKETCKVMSSFNFNIKNAVDMAKLSNI